MNKSTLPIYTLILLTSLFTTSLSAALFTGTLTITSGQLQINASPVTYAFTLSAPDYTSISSGSTITINFPSDYAAIMPTTPTCTGNTGNSVNCNVSSQKITITNYFPTGVTDQTFRFSISGIQNPSHTGSTGSFTVLIANTTHDMVDGSRALTISEGTATCSVSQVTRVVGATTAATFIITPGTAIPANGGLEITFPWGSKAEESMVVTPTSITCSATVNTTATTVGECTPQTISSGTQVIAKLIAGPVPLGSTLNLVVNSIKNPTNQTAVTVRIRTLDASSSSLDACTLSLSANAANAITVDSNFLTCINNGNTKKINVYETCVLRFRTTNPLQSGSQILVKFPTDIVMSANYQIDEDSPYPLTARARSSSYSFPEVMITNAVTEYTAGSTTFNLRFITMRHPGTTKPTTSFQITTYAGGNPVDAILDGVTYTPSAGDLTNVNATASPTTAAGSLSDVTVLFNLGNALSGATTLRIIFPSEFTIGATPVTCTGSGTNIAVTPTTCVWTLNTLNITGYATNALATGSTVRITVHNLILPKDTKPTSTPLQISTLDGGYEVDKSASVYFSSTAGSITSGLNLAISSGAVVAGTSDYTITFQNTNPIPATGQIQIGLPAGNTVTISNQLSVETTTQAEIAGTVRTPTNTKVNMTTLTVTFTNPSGAEIAAGTTIKVILRSLTNPPSTAITNSFTIKTMTVDNFTIDETQTGLNIAADRISPSDFQSVTISPTPSTTGSEAAYTFKVTPRAAHTAAHTLTINFPSAMTFKSTVTCKVNAPTSVAAVSCLPSSNQIVIPMGQNVDPLVTYELVVSGVVNPSLATTYSGFTLLTNISAARVHQTASALDVTIAPSIFTNANMTRSVSTPGATALYTFNFIPLSTYPATAYIEVIVPEQISVSTASTLACQSLLGFSGTPTCQVKSGTTRTITITGGGTMSTRVRFVLAYLVNQGTQVDSDSFFVRVRDTATENIYGEVTSGLEALSPCSSTCLTCQDNNRTACLSCNPGKLYDVVNLNCVDSCVDGTYQDGTQCKGCNFKCKTCSGGSETQCGSCITTSSFPYYTTILPATQSQCQSVCPDTTYPDTLSVCQSCTGNCVTCTTATACKTCDANTFLTGTQCRTYCDSGYYKDTNSRKCLPCPSNCLTCDSLSVCTSCSTSSEFPILHNNNCLSSCPTGYFKNSTNNCEQCQGSCITCTTMATYCLSCTQGLFAELGQCKTCTPPCANCAGSASSCSSCTGSLLLQGNRCVGTCSNGYYVDTGLGICQTCSTGCLSCTSNSRCTSCDVTSLTPYMYDGACVGSCPTGTIRVDRQCVASTVTERVNPYDGFYRSGLPFPFVIFGLIFCILSFVGKLITDQTLVASNMLGFLALVEFASWIALAVLLLLTHVDDSISSYTGFPIVLVGIIASIVVNIVFFFKVIRPLVKTDSFIDWKNKRKMNRASLITSQVFAFISFKSFRLVYSRFFNLEPLSATITDNLSYLSTFHKYLGLNFFLSILPAFIAAVITIHKDSDFPQMLNISIEVIIISLLSVGLSIYEGLKAIELEKKNVVPEKLIGSPSGDDSQQIAFRKGPVGSRMASGRKDDSQMEGSYEYNEGDTNGLNGSSSFLNLNNSAAEKRLNGANNDESFSEFGEGGHGREDISKIEAIEEIEREEDDEEPTLNMNSKTMRKTQDVLKGRGHDLAPKKILIENEDGSIVVLKDTAIPRRAKKNPDGETKDGENGAEESEGELELHDSFDDLEAVKAEKTAGNNDNTKDGKDNNGDPQSHQPNHADEGAEGAEQAVAVNASKELKVSTDGLLQRDKPGLEEEDFEIVNSGMSKRDELSSPADIIKSPDMTAAVMGEGFTNLASPELQVAAEAQGKQGKRSPVAGENKKKDDGFEYVSSDSQVTADDMHDHFMDDTPSNYNVLNQRYDEDFISPAVMVSKKMGPEVVDNMRKSLTGSPQKPVIMQHNFIDQKPDYRKDFPPRPNSNMGGTPQGQQQQATRTSYGKPMLGEKSTVMAQTGMRSLVTPQYSQEVKKMPDSAKGRSGTPTGIGYGSNNKGVTGSMERRNTGIKDSRTGKLSDKPSTDRINELEGLYMKKKETPSMKSSLSKISKNKGKADDDLTDNDELELDNFGKFEEFVNGMKKEPGVKKFEADSFEKE